MSETDNPALIEERVVKAQSHPIRAQILNLLTEGPSSPSKMQRRMPNVSLNLVSHHIKVLLRLKQIELLETRRSERGGFEEHIYRGIDRVFFNDGQWLQIDPRLKDPHTGPILEMISADVSRAAAEGRINEIDDRHLSRSPVELDAEGWKETVEGLKAALATTLEAHERSVERSRKSGEELIPARVVIMQFPVGRSDTVDGHPPESFADVLEALRGNESPSQNGDHPQRMD